MRTKTDEPALQRDDTLPPKRPPAPSVDLTGGRVRPFPGHAWTEPLRPEVVLAPHRTPAITSQWGRPVGGGIRPARPAPRGRFVFYEEGQRYRHTHQDGR